MSKGYTHDGTPIHSGRATSPSGRDPMYTLIGALEGVVLKAHYKDDPDNRSGVWTEYDIMEVTTRMRFKYARVISLFGDDKTGEEKTLTETTGTTDGTVLVMEDASAVTGALVQQAQIDAGLVPTPTSKMNGSRVVFVCLGGVFTQALIIGQVPHPEADFYAKRADAPRTREIVNNWTNTIANDGSMAFVHKDGQQLDFDKDGTLTVKSKGGKAVFKVTADGKILNGDGADEQSILGTSWKSWMSQLLDQMQVETHPTAVGPSGPPLNAAAYKALQAQLDTLLSNYVFVKKTAP